MFKASSLLLLEQFTTGFLYLFRYRYDPILRVVSEEKYYMAVNGRRRG